MELIDKAEAILYRTNDGDNLTPAHLSLVQAACNGRLTDKGIEALNQLYIQATSDAGYSRPWFQGIEFLTQDLQGYIYWKGQLVEHYSFDDRVEEKLAAEELARRCKLLEERSQPVNMTTAVYKWEG